MMSSKLLILVLIFVGVLSGCSKTFDASSEESFKQSRALIEAELSEPEKDVLEKAFRVLLLRAMTEKWENAGEYRGQSFEDIVLASVDNKTQKQVIKLAEKFLAHKNTLEIQENKDELQKITQEYNQAQKDLVVLDAINPKSMSIVEGIWKSPAIQIDIQNNSSVTLAGDSQVSVNIDSIKYKKTVATNTQGFGFKQGVLIKPNEHLKSIKVSLSDLMDSSKRLKAQLKNPVYPITADLAKYDLKVHFKAIKVTSSDGKVYNRPKKSLDEYKTLISGLSATIAELEKKPVTLAALELTDSAENTESAVFNQKYLADLERVRKVHANKKIITKAWKLPGDVTAIMSDAYALTHQRKAGMYSISLSESLEFNNQDERLQQFQIKDDRYIEYRRENDKPEGIINVLHNPQATYDVKASINDQVNSNYYDIIDFDDTGYIYAKFNRCNLFRYVERKGYHYLYTMEYPSIDECIVEFDRSKSMFEGS